MRTDQHEHKHSATMKPRVHRHALTEVDAAIAAMEARVAALEDTMANVILTISQLPGPITPPIDPGDPPVDPVTPPVDPPIVPTTPAPFAPPVTSGTFTVPGSIDATGATDVGAALNAWIATVPDGSVISFPSGTYRLDEGIYLLSRNSLVFEGNRTTLTLTGSGTDYFASAFILQNSNHVAVRGFHVVGPDTAWPALNGENQHVLTLLGWYNAGPSSYVEISGCTGGRVHGDFVYIEGSNGGDFPPSRYVWVHHNSFDYCGRNAVSWINTDQTWVELNTFNHVNYHVFDFEPNDAAESNTKAMVRNNAIGSYAHRAGLIGAFVSATQPGGIAAVLSNITVKDNTVVGIAANGYDGTPRALDTAFWNGGNQRYANLTFTGNSTTRSRDSYAVIYFQNTDGVVCTGNTQPYTGSQMIVAANCTGVVTS